MKFFFFLLLFLSVNTYAEYKDYSHIVGSNFTYHEAVNAVQFWQEFDTKAINRDIGYAESIGMTALRIFLDLNTYLDNPSTYQEKVETLLTIANNHGIQILFVFFDDNWHTDRDIIYNFTPSKGIHNGRWAKCPLLEERGKEHFPKFKSYIQDVISSHVNDKRVMGWGLWNEAGAQGQNWETNGAKEIIEAAILWIKELNPMQPILLSHQAEHLSEVQNPHVYGGLGHSVDPIRGTLVTEAGARAWETDDVSYGGSPCEWIYWLNQQKSKGLDVPGVFLDWELMAGNSHCRWHWNRTPGDFEPPIPWCGIFYKDGTPISLAEAEAIRRYTGKDTLAVLFDDFQDGDYDEWTIKKGSWNVTNSVNVRELKSLADSDENTIISGDPEWLDYTVQATIRLMENGEAGILLRTTPANDSGIQGYFCSITQSKLYLKKIKPNGETIILDQIDVSSSCDYYVRTKVRNSMKVIVRGNNIKIFLNDPRIGAEDIDYTDENAPFLNGYVGFKSTKESRFDDIAVILE